MLPNYQQLMRPFLELALKAEGQEIKLRDVINQLAAQLELSEQEQSYTLPSGRQAVFDNRVGWARTYLTKAGLLESTRRAHFKITPRGITAAQDKNITINDQYLSQFEEFQQFKKGNNDPSNHGAKKSKYCSSGTQVLEMKTADNNQNPMTPDEALLQAYENINDAIADDILRKTREVSPSFFEKLLVNLLIAMGYGGSEPEAGETLGRSGDNGVDGVINQDPLGIDQIYIQAKRYAQGNNVGSGDIRDFFGALNLKRATKGLFITTSDFTSSAISTARDLGSRIVLINGKQLARLMLQYNIGSRNVDILHLKKIDNEFFEIE